jgi:hypothetical protein
MIFGKDNVRLSRQVPPMKSKTKAHPVKHRSDGEFGRRVFASHARHKSAARISGQSVHDALETLSPNRQP